MKRKDIKKAAKWHYENLCLYQDYGDEEVYLDGFVDCADWRINSIWHDASEPPITGKEALVKYMTGDLKIKYRVDVFCGNEWKEMCHYDKLIQFAYIEDLIPNVEEES